MHEMLEGLQNALVQSVEDALLLNKLDGLAEGHVLGRLAAPKCERVSERVEDFPPRHQQPAQHMR